MRAGKFSALTLIFPGVINSIARSNIFTKTMEVINDYIDWKFVFKQTSQKRKKRSLLHVNEHFEHFFDVVFG